MGPQGPPGKGETPLGAGGCPERALAVTRAVMEWSAPALPWVVVLRPAYLPAGNDLSDAGVVEVLTRTAVGGLLFGACLWIGWRVLGRRLWERAAARPPSLAVSPAGA